MPARTGEEYIAGLREQAAEVYICGEQVKDVTTHPAFRNGVRTIASLYDMQHDPARRDAMTYISPATGDRVGRSFITPRTVQDLEQRHIMMAHWARTPPRPQSGYGCFAWPGTPAAAPSPPDRCCTNAGSAAIASAMPLFCTACTTGSP